MYFGQAKVCKTGYGLKRLVIKLNDEYKYRYEHTENHKSFEVAIKLKVPKLPKIGLLEHPQTMPDEYKVPGDPVAAYRDFYRGSKSKFATWKKRGAPDWYCLKASNLKCF